MKPPEVPPTYKEYFCREGSGILTCEYLMNRGCPRLCNFAKRFHPVERGKFLARQQRSISDDYYVDDSFKNEGEFKKTFMRE